MSNGTVNASARQSVLHFKVHPELPQIQSYAKDRGWLDRGCTKVSVFWQDMVYTTDAWQTTQVLRSSTTPSPILNDRYVLENVPPGTRVDFALHIGVACSNQGDVGGHRERGDLWLPGNGNYEQLSR